MLVHTNINNGTAPQLYNVRTNLHTDIAMK